MKEQDQKQNDALVSNLARRLIDAIVEGKGRECWWDCGRTLLERGDEATFQAMLAIVSSLDERARDIKEQEQKARSEVEHVARVGETLQRAGLRSYTDKEGRIFVSGPLPYEQQFPAPVPAREDLAAYVRAHERTKIVGYLRRIATVRKLDDARLSGALDRIAVDIEEDAPCVQG